MLYLIAPSNPADAMMCTNRIPASHAFMDHPFAAAIFAKPSTASILLGEEIPRHASIEIRETFVRKRKRPKNVTGVARAFIIRLLPDGQKGGR